MQELLTQLQSQSPLEWLAVITGLIYVILAAKEKNLCWIFGIISTACWGYASYFHYDLYVDALLQMFYVAMGFYGIYKWQFSKNETNLEKTTNGVTLSLEGHSEKVLDALKTRKVNEVTNLPITQLTTNQHLITIVSGVGISALVGFLFSNYTQAASTYLDSFTTIFSIIATFLTIHKKIDNWIYWIVIDIIYAYLYFSRGALLFGVLMIIYTIIGIFGWMNWNNSLKGSKSESINLNQV